MPRPPDKTQIGIRLPAEVIRHIDAKRQDSTRAEFCGHLIEAGLAGIAGDHRAMVDTVGEMIGPLQQELVGNVGSTLWLLLAAVGLVGTLKSSGGPGRQGRWATEAPLLQPIRIGAAPGAEGTIPTIPVRLTLPPRMRNCQNCRKFAVIHLIARR